MAIQQIHTYCAMCTSRCGVLVTVEDGVLKKVNADPDHPNGCICVKGTADPEIVFSADRLKYPMKRTRSKGEKEPGWVRISWAEAMELTVSRLLDIKSITGRKQWSFRARRRLEAHPPTSSPGCNVWRTPTVALSS